MKIRKRIVIMLLSICFAVPCFGQTVFAADGVIFFDDLETSVGETFTVKGTVVARNSEVGNATVQMSYDTSYLRFVEGDGVNADSSGSLTYTGSGNGNSDRIEFSMTFQALQEGNTRIEQNSATVTDGDGDTVECENGYSDISIGEGDPSKILPEGKTMAVTVNGVEYTLSENFSELEMPSGFVAGDVMYNEETYKGAVQQNSGIGALYLTDSQGYGSFWIYNATSASFYPVEEIMISDTYSIILLDGAGEITMPSEYTPATVNINETAFPAWVEPDRDNFFILYGLNNEGQKSLYLFDSTEHTYQRMEMPKAATASEKKESKTDKTLNIIKDNLVWVLVGAGCIFVVLFVLLIVTAIKLLNRNRELDELYDEYGIDTEGSHLEKEEPYPMVQTVSKKKASRPKYYDDYNENDDFDDDYEDEYEDDMYQNRNNDDYYDEDDFDSEYDDDSDFDDENDFGRDDYETNSKEETDDLAELRADVRSARPIKSNYNDYYDDDEDFDDDFIDDFSSNRSNAKPQDGTFELDFIDLD